MGTEGARRALCLARAACRQSYDCSGCSAKLGERVGLITALAGAGDESGMAEDAAEAAAQPIVASRISLPAHAGIFNLNEEQFTEEDREDFRLPMASNLAEGGWPLAYDVTLIEWRLLLRRMRRAAVVGLLGADAVPVRWAAGAFAVEKAGGDKLRLICGRRIRNCLEVVMGLRPSCRWRAVSLGFSSLRLITSFSPAGV